MAPNRPEQPSLTSPLPRTVLSILTAHAEELTQVAGGRLVGSLTSEKTRGNHRIYALSVRVPHLGDLRSLLLEVLHGANLAFIRMNDHVAICSIELHGLDELDAALERVLLSPAVTEELRVLLARTMH